MAAGDQGCPQGSAFGPLIWNIFQNDLTYTVDANLNMYADDHQFYAVGSTLSDVHDDLTVCAESASSWSYGQLLSMARLSTLHNRRLQDIAILMYKVKNNMCPTYISTLFEQPAIKYELRNHDFTIPRFNTVSFGKHSLRYMGPKVWSSVPSNVKKASTLSSFKYNIRKVDLSMLLDDNNCSNCSLCTS